MKEKKNKPRAVEAIEREAGVMPEKGTKTKFDMDEENERGDQELSANEEDYPETSDEEPSDPEEDEESGREGENDEDQDVAQLNNSTSEDSENEAGTLQIDGKPALVPKSTIKGRRASSKLVGSEEEDADDGDFLTLAPTQRHLAFEVDAGDKATFGSGLLDDVPLAHEDISKRKLKQGITKKGLVALRGSGEKLVFDDEGTAHPLYELVDDKTLTREEIENERKKFIAEQGGRMKDIDVLDKEAIKALRKEKKAAMKLREREVDGRKKGQDIGTGEGDAVLEDNEGEIIPDFDHIDLPSESEEDPEQVRGPGKRKLDAGTEADVEDDLEAMALQALRKKGRHV